MKQSPIKKSQKSQDYVPENANNVDDNNYDYAHSTIEIRCVERHGANKHER
jgi:hypothetical protein